MVGHPIGTYHPTHGVVSHLVVTKFCHCGWSWGAYHPTHCCGWASGARTIPPIVVVGHRYVPSLICIGEESLWTHCGFHLVPHFGGKYTRCLVFTYSKLNWRSSFFLGTYSWNKFPIKYYHTNNLFSKPIVAWATWLFFTFSCVSLVRFVLLAFDILTCFPIEVPALILNVLIGINF